MSKAIEVALRNEQRAKQKADKRAFKRTKKTLKKKEYINEFYSDDLVEQIHNKISKKINKLIAKGNFTKKNKFEIIIPLEWKTGYFYDIRTVPQSFKNKLNTDIQKVS